MNFDAWRYVLRARLMRLLRRPEQMSDAYRRALAADPSCAPAAHALAFGHAQRGERAEAERLLRVVVTLQPDNADAWYNLGFLYEQMHDAPRATEAFREAVRLNAKLDRAWYGLGLSAAARGQHNDAAKAFERAIQLEPMNGRAWYQLGMAYHHLHDPDKVRGIIEHLNRFERHQARRLLLDAERADLAHLVADLKRS